MWREKRGRHIYAAVHALNFNIDSTLIANSTICCVVFCCVVLFRILLKEKDEKKDGSVVLDKKIDNKVLRSILEDAGNEQE
jgi:hypothetical protein